MFRHLGEGFACLSGRQTLSPFREAIGNNDSRTVHDAANSSVLDRRRPAPLRWHRQAQEE